MSLSHITSGYYPNQQCPGPLSFLIPRQAYTIKNTYTYTYTSVYHTPWPAKHQTKQ